MIDGTSLIPFPSPSGLKEALGFTVFVESIKFKDAQKMPDRTLVSSFQFSSTLENQTENTFSQHNFRSLCKTFL